MSSAVIVGFKRSPFTIAKKGSFAEVRPEDLLSQVIIDLVKSFNKKFKNKMQLIVDAVQGSAANPWATKVSINLAKK